MSGATTILRIAVAIIRDENGHVLLVRKHGTSAFMQPGGKIEHGEHAADALCRELAEELSIVVAPDALIPIRQAEAPAANEPDTAVHAEIFEVRRIGPISIAAEIAEAQWVDPAAAGALELAPLTRDHILPLARRNDKVNLV